MDSINGSRIEMLLGSQGEDILDGERPTKRAVILLDEYIKKVFKSLRKQTERIGQIIPLLKRNFASWNHDEFRLLSDKIIGSRLSRLLNSAANNSIPRAARVKVNNFIQSAGDQFEFYEPAEAEAEPEAPESETGPVLCSKTRCSF